MSRADRITIETKKSEFYSDFTTDFLRNPVTGYLTRVTNEESVKQSIRNIILTNRGERLYNPQFGSTVFQSLFGPMDTVAFISIKQSITETINNFEPRAELFDVEVTPYPNNNAVFVKIIFGIKNFQGQAYQLDLLLNRTR